jgi:hypothetical protein
VTVTAADPRAPRPCPRRQVIAALTGSRSSRRPARRCFRATRETVAAIVGGTLGAVAGALGVCARTGPRGMTQPGTAQLLGLRPQPPGAEASPIPILGPAARPAESSRVEVNPEGHNMASMGSAPFTAVSPLIAACLGGRAANLARVDSARLGEDHAIQLADVAGPMDPTRAQHAIGTGRYKVRALRQCPWTMRPDAP